LAQPINDAGAGGKAGASPAKAAVICFVSGVLMSCWPPLQSYAQDPGATDSLNPYFGATQPAAAAAAPRDDVWPCSCHRVLAAVL
jgi:hypothetical protein